MAGQRENGSKKALTPRRRQILQLMAQDLTSREIGKRLGVTAKTVEYHRVQMFQRLQAPALPVRFVLQSRADS
jgi:DNA-binding NarL/FixJ family response regulator